MQVLDLRRELAGRTLAPQPEVGRHQIVPAAARVDARTDLAETLRQLALDERVDVLVGGIGLQEHRLPFLGDRIARIVDRRQIVRFEQARRDQRPSVSLRRSEVVLRGASMSMSMDEVRRNISGCGPSEKRPPQSMSFPSLIRMTRDQARRRESPQLHESGRVRVIERVARVVRRECPGRRATAVSGEPTG